MAKEIVSIGGKEYELTMMSPVEATEVMFVLDPYVTPLSLNRDPLGKLEDLLDEMRENNPADLFRLLAYMLHTDADDLITEEATGEELVHALVACFNLNSLPDLINVAYSMRIVSTGWENGI